MKSIRASLIVYFWLLLALGLGAASTLAYSSAADSLRGKQEDRRKLLETQFADRIRDEEQRFDDRLLDKAKVVAHQVQTQPQWERLRVLHQFVPLGLMTDSQTHLFLPLWQVFQTSGRSSTNPFNQPAVFRRLVDELQLSEADLPHDSDPDVAEVYQVNTEWGITWPRTNPPLPFSPDVFDPAKVVDEKTDNVTLPSGRMLRRVQFKIATRRPVFGGRRGPPPRSTAPLPVDREPRRNDPWMVVHCASETTVRDRAIGGLRTALSDDLRDTEERGQETLAALRRRLIAIALIAFLLTTIGGYVLVGFGLAPLRRVTEAVSRVSPRNFRLPLPDDEPLPKELTPIRDRLQDTLDELRKAFEREKQAAADISHELRTPVASILTTVEVALRKPRSAEEYRQTLEDCRGLARQMRQLVERIMALARLDAGSDRLRPRPVDVGELVQECAALVKPLAGERGLELRVHCPKPVVWTTDPDKLREVLVNLLHNAVEYNKPAGAIDVSAQAADGWLDVQVHDTGVGIAAEAFEHIFERFYRADPSRHASELHAGLGLSIVKGYVGLLGGTITVDSRVGQGSTFRVRLPRAAAAA